MPGPCFCKKKFPAQWTTYVLGKSPDGRVETTEDDEIVDFDDCDSD